MSGRTTARPEDPLRVRERAEREARFVARAIPDSGRVVGLVYGGSGAARSAEAAASIASAVGLRREHTLLTAAQTGPGSLDERIGGADGPGLWDALAGRARLTEAALRSERRSYSYIPAGATCPGPKELLSAPGLRRFAERAREQGGTLLIHLPEKALAGAADLLDGFVRLGVLAVAVPDGLAEYGRVVFPEEEAASVEEEPEPEPRAAPEEPGPEPPAGAAPEVSDASAERAAPELQAGTVPELSAAPEAGPERAGSGRWRRHRTPGRLPMVRSAIGALIVLALGIGWWLLSRESLADPFGRPGPVESPEARPVEGPEARPMAGSEASSEALGGEEPSEGAAALASRIEEAPELPYSVLIASYARASDAEQRVRDLAGFRSTLFYVSPTPVRGRLYHRVFAGALGDAEGARELMEDLVESGRKEASSAWDVRPVRLAFRLGVYGSRAEAERAVAEAVAAGVPAYVLPAGGRGDTAYQAFAGAYESESAARALEPLLERAGLATELVDRRGVAH